ncbi:hypothetical protein N480_00015 [Pseudoalteromonas luteoviolacea S2607]|nr:hypothetical protein N480_00015 [Pseudoalteromonas luteoviolacea S2607]
MIIWGTTDQKFKKFKKTPILNFAKNCAYVLNGSGCHISGAVAVIGGTISEITGGKFSNGAATAAFVQLQEEFHRN